MSKHLDPRQLRAIDRLGDRMLPGDEGMVAFSETGCVRDVDRILDYMPESDLNDLKMLLTVLSYFPGIFLTGLLLLLESSSHIPTPIGSLLRFMRLGIRGLIMTLYYSNPQTHEAIGFSVKVYTADLK